MRVHSLPLSKASASTGSMTNHTLVMPVTLCGKKEIGFTAKTAAHRRRQMHRTGLSSQPPCRRVAREQQLGLRHPLPRSSGGRLPRTAKLKTVQPLERKQQEPMPHLQTLSSRKAMNPSHTWTPRQEAVQPASRHHWCQDSSPTMMTHLPAQFLLRLSFCRAVQF